jgi:hypothetical protein
LRREAAPTPRRAQRDQTRWGLIGGDGECAALVVDPLSAMEKQGRGRAALAAVAHFGATQRGGPAGKAPRLAQQMQHVRAVAIGLGASLIDPAIKDQDLVSGEHEILVQDKGWA